MLCKVSRLTLNYVVACLVLCTVFLVLPLLPLFAYCILGSKTTTMASMGACCALCTKVVQGFNVLKRIV